MNLFKLILLPAIFSILMACTKNEKPDSATINIDASFEKLGKYEILSYDLLNLKAHTLIKDTSKIAVQLDILEPTLYYLKINENFFPIYLEPGFNLEITSIQDKVKRKIKFVGKGSEINNQLTKLQLINNKYHSGTPFYKLSANDFLLRIDSLRRDFSAMMKDAQPNSRKELLRKIFEVNVITQKLNYALVNFNLLDKDMDIHYEIRSAFSQILNYPELLDIGLLDVGLSLHMYLDAVIYPSILQKEYSDQDSLKNLFPLMVNDSLKKRKLNEGLREFLLAKNINNQLLSKGISENTKMIFGQFQSEYPKSKYISTIKELNDDLTDLVGELVPDVSCVNLDNKEITLRDFKGKIVYVDIWATWCKPCIEEFPKSKSLYQKYSNKEVAFVYLSVDNDRTKWKEFVNKNIDLKGIHIVEEENGSIFKAFQLSGIPRYVLIDRKGRIVNVNAPRPSSGKIESMIDNLLSS